MEMPRQMQGLTLRNEEFFKTQQDTARLGILTTEKTGRKGNGTE